MGSITSITKDGLVNISKTEDGSYCLNTNGTREKHASVQSVWAALDELDAPRRDDTLADAA
jgi:hypothetical protein